MRSSATSACRSFLVSFFAWRADRSSSRTARYLAALSSLTNDDEDDEDEDDEPQAVSSPSPRSASVFLEVLLLLLPCCALVDRRS